MLVNMRDLLQVAYENKFAVGSFNVANSEFVKVVVSAAEEQKSPAILQIHPNEINLVTDEFVAYVREAASKSKVPFVIHLDHGATIEDITRSIRNGYTSVMMDASHLPFEENMTLTKKAVELAHIVGVSVEGELGTIGSNEGSSEGGTDEILYTDPDEAAIFVEKTGIDTLAVAVGTSHGLYPKTKDHSIKIDRLMKIHERVKIPLVLHGGSDNPDEEIREAVKHGIAKINLSTDMKRAFYNQLRATLYENPDAYEPDLLMPEATKAAIELVKKKMDLFGSTGKASLYKLGEI
ncbi:ketose-bisphosphate aldolase [Priestia megaterium]|uniref:Ketose-bisphosphate aldolase n=1 Tax=Priestia megaterium TaxID=1404 RepID=A0A2C0NF65_PRIMG|nr:ketose-bisphosphate aldolase [Priestia megaterium]MDD9781469.1 ketose-bisphosphate aldolase [Priestia megaterium]MDH3169105.1 ketose-bisphosphate aldolase [Priestia megaterium]MED3816113.1 ketose-bisphosphate aldolase [Priestia megaterium]PFI95365.1 ketose-bisphosphate aldolase [Priestia megaterium]PGR15250.1 ketose-bisphosphate aldolase [Priestia megaterium]